MKPGDRQQAGFTLIEIALAVAILGVGLTTLVSLQTRYLDSYVTEHNRTKATLYARYLMTIHEVSTLYPEPGIKEDNLSAKLKEAGYFDESEHSQKLEEDLKLWKYKEEVSIIPVMNKIDALRRIDLQIRWGETAREEYNLVYFRHTDLRAGKN